jgi:hypothetical protein
MSGIKISANLSLAKGGGERKAEGRKNIENDILRWVASATMETV